MWLNDATIYSLLLLLISIACNFSSTESKKKEKTNDPGILNRIQDEIYRSMKRIAQDKIEHADVNKYVAFKEKTEAEVIVEVNTWLELKQEVKERIIYIETGMWPGDETPKKEANSRQPEANKPNETEAPPQQTGGKGVAATQTVGNVSAKQTEAQANVADTKKSIQKEKPPQKRNQKTHQKRKIFSIKYVFIVAQHFSDYTMRHYMPYWSARVTKVFAKRELRELAESFAPGKDWRPLGGYTGGSGAKLFLTDDEKYVLKIIKEEEGSAIIRKYDMYAKYVTDYPKVTAVESLIVTNFGYFVYEDKEYTIRLLIMDNLSYGLTANFKTYDLKGNGRIIGDEPKTFLNKIFGRTGNTVSKPRPAKDDTPDKRSGTPSSDKEKPHSRSSSPGQQSSRGSSSDQRSSRDSSPNNRQSPDTLPGTFPQDNPIMEPPSVQRMPSTAQRIPSRNSSGRSTPTLTQNGKDVNGNDSPNTPDGSETDPVENMEALQEKLLQEELLLKDEARRKEREKLGVLTEPHIMEDFLDGLRIVDVKVIYYKNPSKQEATLLDSAVAQSLIGWGMRFGLGRLEKHIPAFLKPQNVQKEFKKTVAKPMNNKYIEIIKKDREILEKMKITDYSLAVFVSETAIDPKDTAMVQKIREDNPQETYLLKGEKLYKMHLAYIDTWVIYEGAKVVESNLKRIIAGVTFGDPEKVTVQRHDIYNKRIGVFLAGLVKADTNDKATVLYDETDDQPASGNRQKRQTAILPNYYH